MCLFKAEFFSIPIKDQPFASDKPNVQQTPRAADPLVWDAVDERMPLELGRPDGREIVSLAHHLGARTRQIACSFIGHE